MRPRTITLSVDPPLVKVILHEWVDGAFKVGGKSENVRYEDAQAQAVLQAINTGNFSNVSLRQRLMERLITDGKVGEASITND